MKMTADQLQHLGTAMIQHPQEVMAMLERDLHPVIVERDAALRKLRALRQAVSAALAGPVRWPLHWREEMHRALERSKP